MYVDEGGGGGQRSVDWGDIGKGIGSIGASMDAFAGAAASGGFEVNETGGQALLNAIRGMKRWVDRQQMGLLDIAQRLPLGGSHAAQVISPYVQQVAIDDQGFLTQLAQFSESLEKAEKGIETAMANYRATEEAKRSAFRGIEPV
ncbi:hypothetical protein LWC34_44040 [Kibdelosporangium philippinense]|uniref:PE domain-containing protein n=1 Tax=Kibdelosporangium philippinense TaxID=211113 RepID=A0ABS8ZPQ3_9PSEU|nr:hypothetical protein [Kibdelosporangium philippinense]MCE7009735.1 hypothetical protein [Kibdelosporangium philippinense]